MTLGWLRRNLGLFGYLILTVGVVLALWLSWRQAQDDAERAEDTRRLSLQNCTTVNENTEAVYQVVLAFKALADIISRDLPPDQKLEVRVEAPEYLDC